MEPYILGMPEEDYHAHPALSSSGVRTLLRNPARYNHEKQHGRPPRDYFDFGSVAHARILGTGWGLLVWPLDEWRGTVECELGKVSAAEFRSLARKAGCIPIKRKDLMRVADIQAAVEEHPIAGPLLARPGVSEVSLFWLRMGVECRARIDRLTEDDNGDPLMVDVKTTQDASPRAIAQHVARYGYHIQQEWYLDGLARTKLDPFWRATAKFIFVESEPPHSVTVATLDREAAETGATKIVKGLQLYTECMRTDRWPTYTDREITVGLPRWAHFEED